MHVSYGTLCCTYNFFHDSDGINNLKWQMYKCIDGLWLGKIRNCLKYIHVLTNSLIVLKFLVTVRFVQK